MKKSTKAAVSSLENASATYRELQQTNVRLQEELSSVEQKISAAHNLIVQGKGPSLAGEQQRRVAEILGDDLANVELSADRGELKKLEARQRDLNAALEVVKHRLSIERREAGKKICEEVRPRYEGAVRAIVEAMLPVREAIVVYEAVTNELHAQDVPWLSSFASMHAGSIVSRLDTYMREAARNGYVDPASLPAAVIESEKARPSAYAS